MVMLFLAAYSYFSPVGAVEGGGTNPQAKISDISGCPGKDTGLFRGLILTGQKIYNGLRDLIYVVAGFGIIGVAVGGFFGNLNWKWLGAIMISLVVIASTGEIINMVVGCETFTQDMIADTLKE
ncbi:MAG: hypothetical protein E7012_01975 [Alphaproteobacteria bacterium]|nr:hypothetical protein [Alphaproteobacteria bacterium]